MLTYAIFSFVICLTVGVGSWAYSEWDYRRSLPRRARLKFLQAELEKRRTARLTPAE
ncbi:hypothetical protein FHS20_000065 [Phyllobacterium endophyticum]|nr:hypothetical protein [Phyllobacterium endophyticum]